MSHSAKPAAAVATLLLFTLVAGCKPRNTFVAPPPPPKVTVALPEQRNIVETMEFTGTTRATARVELRARVNGYLQKISFPDGSMVKEGEPLFVIEPAPYEAELQAAQAQVQKIEANQQLAVANPARTRRLFEQNAATQQQPVDAYQLLRRTQHLIAGWQLPPEDHLGLAEALEHAEQWNEAVVLWEEFVALHPKSAEHIRIHAAGCILDRQQRPHAALRMLAPLSDAKLRPELDKQRRRIASAAQNLIDSGVIELDQAGRQI